MIWNYFVVLGWQTSMYFSIFLSFSLGLCTDIAGVVLRCWCEYLVPQMCVCVCVSCVFFSLPVWSCHWAAWDSRQMGKEEAVCRGHVNGTSQQIPIRCSGAFVGRLCCHKRKETTLATDTAENIARLWRSLFRLRLRIHTRWIIVALLRLDNTLLLLHMCKATECYLAFNQKCNNNHWLRWF